MQNRKLSDESSDNEASTAASQEDLLGTQPKPTGPGRHKKSMNPWVKKKLKGFLKEKEISTRPKVRKSSRLTPKNVKTKLPWSITESPQRPTPVNKSVPQKPTPVEKSVPANKKKSTGTPNDNRSIRNYFQVLKEKPVREQSPPPKRTKFMAHLAEADIHPSKLRSKAPMRHVRPAMNKFDRGIFGSTFQHGVRHIWRRNAFAKYHIKPNKSPKCIRIQEPIINQINQGIDVQFRCTRRHSSKSTRKVCGGKAQMLVKGLKKRRVYIQCEKCGDFEFSSNDMPFHVIPEPKGSEIAEDPKLAEDIEDSQDSDREEDIDDSEDSDREEDGEGVVNEDTANDEDSVGNEGTARATKKPKRPKQINRDDLKICFVTLLADMGHVEYERILSALGLECASRSTYYRHAKSVYVLQERSFLDWQKKAFAEIKETYAKQGVFPDDEGKLPIIVSHDGSYPKRGLRAQSLFCVSFIFECYTGVAIDCEVTKRCTLCDNREVLRSKCKQKNKLFHGKATDLEVETASRLFKKSLEYPVKYCKIVCDGDSSTFKNVKDTYGIDSVTKEECIPHYKKRAWKHINELCEKLCITSLTVKGKNKLGKNLGQPGDFKNRFPLRPIQGKVATRLSWLCIIAMRQNLKKKNPAEAMSRAVRSIPRHYSDWSGATTENRNYYHKFCQGQWCAYARLKTDEERNEFRPSSDGIFGCYKKNVIPEGEQTKLYKKFDTFLGHVNIMMRCTLWLNQNINESIHSRLYDICSKADIAEVDRLRFAGRHCCVTNNVGRYGGTLLTELGMTEYEEDMYKRADEYSEYRATNPTPKERKKLVAVKQDNIIQYQYGLGFEEWDKQYELVIPEYIPNPIPDDEDRPEYRRGADDPSARSFPYAPTSDEVSDDEESEDGMDLREYEEQDNFQYQTEYDTELEEEGNLDDCSIMNEYGDEANEDHCLVIQSGFEEVANPEKSIPEQCEEIDLACDRQTARRLKKNARQICEKAQAADPNVNIGAGSSRD